MAMTYYAKTNELQKKDNQDLQAKKRNPIERYINKHVVGMNHRVGTPKLSNTGSIMGVTRARSGGPGTSGERITQGEWNRLLRKDAALRLMPKFAQGSAKQKDKVVKAPSQANLAKGGIRVAGKGSPQDTAVDPLFAVMDRISARRRSTKPPPRGAMQYTDLSGKTQTWVPKGLVDSSAKKKWYEEHRPTIEANAAYNEMLDKEMFNALKLSTAREVGLPDTADLSPEAVARAQRTQEINIAFHRLQDIRKFLSSSVGQSLMTSDPGRFNEYMDQARMLTQKLNSLYGDKVTPVVDPLPDPLNGDTEGSVDLSGDKEESVNLELTDPLSRDTKRSDGSLVVGGEEVPYAGTISMGDPLGTAALAESEEALQLGPGSPEYNALVKNMFKFEKLSPAEQQQIIEKRPWLRDVFEQVKNNATAQDRYIQDYNTKRLNAGNFTPYPSMHNM